MPKTIKKKTLTHNVGVGDIEEIQSIFSKVFEERRKAVLYAVGVIAMIGLLGGGLVIYNTNKAGKALLIEGQAIKAFYTAAASNQENQGSQEGENAYSNALKLFQEASDIKKTPVSLFYIAESYLKIGEKDKAIEAYQRFLSSYGKSTLASAVRARVAAIRMDDGDYAGALAEMESIKDDVVWSDTALRDMADIYNRMGKADEAKSSLNELISSFPGSPWVLEAKNIIGKEDETSELTKDEATNSAKPELASPESKTASPESKLAVPESKTVTP